MSSDWRATTLGDVCLKITDGAHASPKSVSVGKPMASVKDLTRFGIDLSSARLISVADFENLVKQGCRPEIGDVLIAKDGNSALDTVCNVKSSLDAVLLSSVAILRPNPEKIDTDFLKFYLSSSDVVEYLKNTFISGAAIPRVVLRDFKKAEINIPPLSIQKEIATVLNAIEDRIFTLRETNTTLEAIAQALFKSWFVDFDPVHAKMQGRAPEGMDEATAALFPDSFEESELGAVPKGWRVERLGDVVERVTKGTTPTTLRRPFVEKGINFVKAESMTDDGEFLPEKLAYIDDETHELLKRSQLQDGDVLISIAGTIGRSAVITEDFLPANTNQAVALIRPKQDVFPSSLLWRFLKQENAVQLMGERVVQAVQANLSLGTLSDIQLVLPPKWLTMKLFEIAFSAIDESKALNSQKVRVLSMSRDTLLPRLISGQLRVDVLAETSAS